MPDAYAARRIVTLRDGQAILQNNGLPDELRALAPGLREVVESV